MKNGEIIKLIQSLLAGEIVQSRRVGAYGWGTINNKAFTAWDFTGVEYRVITQHMLDIEQAQKDGKVIQYRRISKSHDQDWITPINDLSLEAPNIEYRIKPEEYVELSFEEWENLIGEVVCRTTSSGTTSKHLITDVMHNGVVVNGVQRTPKDMLEIFTFVNGEKCGKLA